MKSPLGTLLLTGDDTENGFVLTALSLRDAASSGPAGPFAEVIRQLEAYFAGERTRFDLPVKVNGTDFQRRVWDALDQIPYGVTTTYGALATRLGLPRDHIQALGAAIGANPLLIVRPCHRVIGADGSMRGYAGGVDNKVRLLTLEGALQPALFG
jgi:methylated-DNA-[protein]-cysteine S-methyltransferase